MVFWATILSFIIGLLSYMMYPRNDKHIMEYLPASEAYISSFVTQHQAAKDYLREALIGLQNMPGTVPNGNVMGLPVGKEGSVMILSPEITVDDDGNVLLEEGQSEGILPFLPKIQSIMPTSEFKPVLNEENSGGFVSVLGCFSYPERRLKTGEYMPSRLQNCTSEEAETKYVFTYGPLPDIYQPVMQKNILIWEAAILKRTHGNPDCGFLQKRGDRYFINTSSRLTRTIPSEFARLLESDYISIDSATKRVFVGVGEYEAPLLFCMTPANDPYPRKGLVLNLDSIINTGVAGQHATIIDEMPNGWANLARSGAYADIENGLNEWHLASKGVPEDKGFTFGHDRYIKTGIQLEDLGSSFTISMLLYNNNTNFPYEYALFGSNAEMCIPQPGRPCLYAKVRSGLLRIMLLENGSKISTVTGRIPFGQITQVDYIVNPGNHKLLINGSIVDMKEISGDNDDIGIISKLAASPLLIGSDNIGYKWPIDSGMLYNFIVYKRGVMDDPSMSSSGTTDQFDVRGLARIYRTNSIRYDY